MRKLCRFALDERGATAIEYGLLASVLAVVIAAVFPLVEPALTTLFETISADMANPLSDD